MLRTICTGAAHVTIVALALLVMLPLGTLAQAAANEHESALGYVVTWTDDWVMDEEFALFQDAELDILTLFTADGLAFVMITGFNATNMDPLAMIEPEPEDIVAEQDLQADVPYTLLDEEGAYERTELYVLDEGATGLTVSVWGPEEGFDDLVTSAQKTIQVNGSPVMTGQPLGTQGTSADETPEATQATGRTSRTTVTDQTPESTSVSGRVVRTTATDQTLTVTQTTGRTTTTDETPESTEAADGMETYSGSDYGFSFNYDPKVWTVEEVFAGDGYEGALLKTDGAALMIWASDLYGEDPVACLDGEAEYFGTKDETVTNWEPITQSNGDELRYESQDSAWGVFTLELNGTSVVDYVECQAIPGQNATIVAVLTAEPADYDAKLDLATVVLDTLEFVDQP